MSFAEHALDQIRFARKYTLRLLEQTREEDWCRQPSEGITHIAWQVGHLAMAQYRLALERLRGARPEDKRLISAEFLAYFGKGSSVDTLHDDYGRDDLLEVFHRVHEQVCQEVPTYMDAELELPPVKPHSLFNTKRESLLWCGHHEMVHAGQIGLLRRLLGYPPIW